MDITPTASNTMGPPLRSSPDADPHSTIPNGGAHDHSTTPNSHQGNSLTAAAATSSSQPKMVNTAFIHKLYKCDFRVRIVEDMLMDSQYA